MCALLTLNDTIEWMIPEIRFMGYGHYETFYSLIYQLQDSKWRLEASKTDMLRIFLFNVDPGTPKMFMCKIKSSLNDEVFIRFGNFKTKSDSWEPVLVIDSNEVLLVRNVVITCCIEKYTSYIEIRDFKTEKSVTGNENPKDEEWSLIDIKDDTLFRERMKELLTKGTDHDVTICVQDKQYRAHRNILSTRSPVFAMMLSHDSKEKNTGVIEIEDCDPESFYEFLLYVYSGRTENLTPSNAFQLYYSADKYDFPVLKERCVKILKNSLSVESICDVVLLASKHLEKELLQVATEFFARNMKEILVTVSWQKFMSQNLVVANELLIKSTEIKNPEN